MARAVPETRPDLVVVPCGGKKRRGHWPAGLLYLGPYHKACMRYALHLMGGDRQRIVILSAKYGLLRLGDWVDSYDLRMGARGSVTAARVLQDARRLGLLGDGRVVVALGGKDYTDVCRQVFGPTRCRTPLDGVGGIGKQLAWMKRQTTEARQPCTD